MERRHRGGGLPGAGAPEPVYMDFEDEVLEELGRDSRCPRTRSRTGCARPCAPRWVPAGRRVFSLGTRARTRQWNRNGRVGPPPFLGVLAAFCLAAEQMAAGDGMSQANYFGRLRRLLGYEPDDSKVDTAYRRVAERFWGTLNGWLIDLDGRRGLPTAYALTHRYVGLTLSQALVRQADRDRFNEFFRKYGFAPGSDVPPSELQPVLDSWFSQDPCPVSASLQRLWKRGEARERISQVAAVALAAWDGRVASRGGGGAVTAGHLALGLEFGGFPKKRLSVQALLYLPQASQPREGTILTATPETVVELVPEVQGALGLGRSSSLHPEDVLEGVLKIRDSLTGSVLERRPRRLVLFRQDEITRRWIESPQVQLGEHVSLLVHADLVPRLDRVLSLDRPAGVAVKA